MKQEEEQIKLQNPQTLYAMTHYCGEADAPYCGDFYQDNSGSSRQCFSCGNTDLFKQSLWKCTRCSYQECHRCTEHHCSHSHWVSLPLY